MASKTSKWMTVVASGAISVLMGGAAFAAPASALEGNSDGASDPISQVLGKVASQAGTRVAEVKQQAREVLSGAR